MIGPYPDWVSTNQGVVGPNPASRAKIKDLAPQNQVLHVTSAGPFIHTSWLHGR
jgi:hypothetical protein